MMFRTSALDLRKLWLTAHTIGRQPPGRREFVHGKIHPLRCKCRACQGETK